MSPSIIIVFIVGYFLLLIAVSYFTSKGANNDSFYTGNHKSPWYLVAFGMIGASLSGITFISIPGTVYGSGMTYMAIAIGYFFGYLVISYLLIPLYYQLNLTTIYTYLKERFGNYSHKTGALYFMLSRVIGASLRLFLVTEVLDIFLFQPLAIPYWIGIVVTVLLIWVYTFKGGIKTIVWTDTLQTIGMLVAVGATIYFIKDDLGLSTGGLVKRVFNSPLSSIVEWKGGGWGTFLLGVVNGAFITIVMTGLDQDMMQKNLTCKNKKEAQKNMFWFSIVLIPVNLLFLSLGVLLFEYSLEKEYLQIVEEAGKYTYHLFSLDFSSSQEITSDRIFPMLASQGYFPLSLGLIFLMGLIAAAYSSADSALTSLTTSFTIDILDKQDNALVRRIVHIGMSITLVLVILIFKQLDDESVVWKLFKAAGYTYGPLLGLFSFGLFIKRDVKDKWVPVVCLISPILLYILNIYSKELFYGYQFGFEILILNGLMTFLGLLIISRPSLHNV